VFQLQFLLRVSSRVSEFNLKIFLHKRRVTPAQSYVGQIGVRADRDELVPFTPKEHSSGNWDDFKT
jgi:hypothetical protein